jgi:hypothetical protein
LGVAPKNYKFFIAAISVFIYMADMKQKAKNAQHKVIKPPEI